MEQDQLLQEYDKDSLLAADREHMWHHMSPYNPNPMIVTGAKAPGSPISTATATWTACPACGASTSGTVGRSWQMPPMSS